MKYLTGLFGTTLFYTTITLMIFSCTPEGAWDLLMEGSLQESSGSAAAEGWNCRMKLAIDNSASPEALTDFPVLVRFDNSNITYSAIKPDGSDITFLDSTSETELDFEVDTWNYGGESLFWVRLPLIPASSADSYFWAYYSSSTKTGTENPAGVWDSSYRGVWHLGESGGPSYSDSSQYSNHGTGGTNGHGTPLAAPGRLGGGQHFGATEAAPGESIAVPSDASIDNLGPLSLEFWASRLSNAGNIMFSKNQLQLQMPLNPAIRLNVSFTTTDLYGQANVLADSSWYYVAISWDGSSSATGIDYYLDGLPMGMTGSSDASGGRDSDAASTMYIGNSHVFGAPLDYSRNVILDEFRISSVKRSDAWIGAQHLSQTDAFLTYGGEENIP